VSDDHKLPAVVERTLEQREVLHPLVLAATGGGQAVDPDTLNKLLAVQERWEAGEARKAYNRAMARAKSDLPAVLRKDAKGHTNTYASLAGITDAVTGPLSAHGFTVSFVPEQGEGSGGDIRITCVIKHEQGHQETFSLASPPDKGAGRSGVQSIGSTITYLRRYTLAGALGLATADMPDADEGAAGDRIEPTRNLRVAAALKKYDRDRIQAEEFLGRGCHAWTATDLNRLAAWARGVAVEQAEDEMGPAAGWGPDEIKRLDGMVG